ncbi:hypothetical protein U1Q18_024699 [Sarracenia purpurea var. burkii]
MNPKTNVGFENLEIEEGRRERGVGEDNGNHGSGGLHIHIHATHGHAGGSVGSLSSQLFGDFADHIRHRIISQASIMRVSIAATIATNPVNGNYQASSLRHGDVRLEKASGRTWMNPVARINDTGGERLDNEEHVLLQAKSRDCLPEDWKTKFWFPLKNGGFNCK